jgi:hypothetical protein
LRLVRSRVVKLTLFAVSAIAALLAILVAVAHAGFVRARVLDWALASASRDLGIRVEADSLQYNLLAASAQLRNARVSAPDERAFFRADAVRVDLVRGALPRVEVDRLEIERPHLTIVRHADGTTNLPAGGSSPTSKPAPVHLGRVALSATTIEFEDESAGHRLTATPIDLVLDTRAGSSAPGAFGPTAVAATVGSTNQQVPPQSVSGTIAGRLGFDGSRLTIHELRLDAPEGRLALDGWVDVLAEVSRVEAHAALESDLARARRFIPGRDLALTGSAMADVAVSGNVEDPTVRVKVLGPAIALGSVPTVNVSANATYASGRVDIESLSIASDAGTIDVNGVLALMAPPRAPRDNQLVGRIANLDVDRLLDALAVPSTSARSRPVSLAPRSTPLPRSTPTHGATLAWVRW